MKNINIVQGVNNNIMKTKKQYNKEILIKFKQTPNPKELDEMLYQFEKELKEENINYYLKESENPFIYFLENDKPEELIKLLKISEEYCVIPVTCVINNMNYITSVILRKIRHKLCYKDTFKINCYMDSYCISQTEDNIENELTKRIENIIKIEYTTSNPVWTINLYVVGDITAINIINTKSNRVANMWT